MKSVQLGSAACDGQMAKSTWKYKWVCTRRGAGSWLMDATCCGHGLVMQEEGAPWAPTLLRGCWFAPPQGPNKFHSIPSLEAAPQVKFSLLKKAMLVIIEDIYVLSFPVWLQQPLNTLNNVFCSISVVWMYMEITARHHFFNSCV